MDSKNFKETYTETTYIDYTETTAETTLSAEPSSAGAEEILEPEVFEEEDPETLTAKAKKEKEKNCGKKEKENFPAFTFADFWETYNKKIGKDRAAKLWEKLSPEKKMQILTHLSAYLPETERENRRYRVKPEKYLREEYFNDEIIAINGTEQQQTKTNGNARRFSTSAAISQLID